MSVVNYIRFPLRGNSPCEVKWTFSYWSPAGPWPPAAVTTIFIFFVFFKDSSKSGEEREPPAATRHNYLTVFIPPPLYFKPITTSLTVPLLQFLLRLSFSLSHTHTHSFLLPCFKTTTKTTQQSSPRSNGQNSQRYCERAPALGISLSLSPLLLLHHSTYLSLSLSLLLSHTRKSRKNEIIKKKLTRRRSVCAPPPLEWAHERDLTSWIH